MKQQGNRGGAFLLLENTFLGDGKPLSSVPGQFSWCQGADLSVPGASAQNASKGGQRGAKHFNWLPPHPP